MSAAHDALASLGAGERLRALAWLCERLGLPTPAGVSVEAVSGPRGGGRGAAPTGENAAGVRQLLGAKKPATAAERVLLLGFYLTKHAKQSAFRTRDLSRLNTEAALEKFTNATVAVNAAVKKGWFNNQGGRFTLTTGGERYVNALPDRAAAEEGAPRRGRGRPRKKRG
ncbi:MAG: hypothetical protein AB2A00_07330 [Myxococcota bacterium]